MIALVVQNLPKSVLYIQIFFLLIKDVAFLFSCFHHYHCGCSNWLLVASLIQQMSFLSCLFLDIFQKKYMIKMTSAEEPSPYSEYSVTFIVSWSQVCFHPLWWSHFSNFGVMSKSWNQSCWYKTWGWRFIFMLWIFSQAPFSKKMMFLFTHLISIHQCI